LVTLNQHLIQKHPIKFKQINIITKGLEKTSIKQINQGTFIETILESINLLNQFAKGEIWISSEGQVLNLKDKINKEAIIYIKGKILGG
jgi:hypothetical protein